MLKVGGIWCSPVEIESCLIGHPAVLEAAVVGHADEDELIKPKAIVVLKQAGGGDAALTEELMAHCKKTLAPYKYPRWVEYVPELPKTATGKIQRFKLRACVIAYDSSPAVPSAAEGAVQAAEVHQRSRCCRDDGVYSLRSG